MHGFHGGHSHRKHKSDAQRTLLTVRAALSQAKECLDDKETLLALLEEAEGSLRRAETHLHREARTRVQTTSGIESSGVAGLGAWNQYYSEEDRNCAQYNHDMGDTSPMVKVSSQRRMSLNDSLQLALAEAAVSSLLKKAGDFEFDAISFTQIPEATHQSMEVLEAMLQPISLVGLHLTAKRDLVTLLFEPQQSVEMKEFHNRFTSFLGQLDKRYKHDAPYHGRAHAVDVMSTVDWLLSSSYVANHTAPLDHFMAIVAAAIHDVGHEGRNNLFYTKTEHSLAITYNDRSVLENMHLALAFQIMFDKMLDANWFKLLSPEQQGYVRKGLVSMVLATDPSRHKRHTEELSKLVEESQEEAGEEAARENKQQKLDDKLLVLQTILHASDISNPTKPRPLMLGWTERLLDEFWAQGDEERSLGLPVSPLCDRVEGRRNVPQGQVGFINFVVQPYYAIITELIPEAQKATDQLALNKSFWEDKAAEGAGFEDIFKDGAR